MTCGVYAIKTSGRQVYIGQARVIEKRWEDHVRTLRSGHHPNRALQLAYNANDGIIGWTFSVLETCEKNDLNDVEKRQILTLRGTDCNVRILKPVDRAPREARVKVDGEPSNVDALLAGLNRRQAEYEAAIAESRQIATDAQIERQDVVLAVFEALPGNGRLELVGKRLGVKIGRVQQMLAAARLRRAALGR